MWNRKELKARAKAAFKRNYWYCVFAALIMTIILGASASGSTGNAANSAETGVNVSIAYRAVALVFLARIFAFNPLEIGLRKFFAENAVNNVPLTDVPIGFTGNYMRNVLAMFLEHLFIALWTLVFVIPGIVKIYAYRMVPYILADHPELSAKEALDMSSRMMRGNKWRAFVMDLSFIGWHLLSVLTLGLLELFYVAPYVNAAHAELYLALRDAQ